jgi:tRNA threonylcarbamoyladenosine biosynthesis protein TsaB
VIVLGLDTATLSTAVGLRLADGSALQARDDPATAGSPGHATRLLAMVAALLERAGVAWSELDRIAVGLGPGRFTGLRVGVTTARGLAQSLSLQLAGVSTLGALADAAAVRGAEGCDGVLSVIDALRGEAFAGAYLVAGRRADGELSFPGPLAPEALQGIAAQADERAGAGRRRWLAVGDGAVRYRLNLEAAGVLVPADQSPLHLVQGGTVCELGARGPAAPAYEQVVPDYRRVADARVARTTPGVAGGGTRARQPGPRVGSQP